MKPKNWRIRAGKNCQQSAETAFPLLYSGGFRVTCDRKCNWYMFVFHLPWTQYRVQHQQRKHAFERFELLRRCTFHWFLSHKLQAIILFAIWPDFILCTFGSCRGKGPKEQPHMIHETDTNTPSSLKPTEETRYCVLQKAIHFATLCCHTIAGCRHRPPTLLVIPDRYGFFRERDNIHCAQRRRNLVWCSLQWVSAFTEALNITHHKQNCSALRCHPSAEPSTSFRCSTVPFYAQFQTHTNYVAFHVGTPLSLLTFLLQLLRGSA